MENKCARGALLDSPAGADARISKFRVPAVGAALVTDSAGLPFSIRGPVIPGEQRGRTLGFPTANVRPNGARLPDDGVYAGWLTRRDTAECMLAAISIGTNPTFAGDRARIVESYVINRVGLELYAVEVEVTLGAWLRGIVAFDSAEALVQQMRKDVATIDVRWGNLLPAHLWAPGGLNARVSA